MDARALELHREWARTADKHRDPHNRRPHAISLADLRRRRTRRRTAERLRSHLQDLAAGYAMERLYST
jgi:hypothetical protein